MSKQRYALCGLSFKIMEVQFFYLQYNTSKLKIELVQVPALRIPIQCPTQWNTDGAAAVDKKTMSNGSYFVSCYAGTSFRHTPTLWTHLLKHNVHHFSPRTLKLFIAYWYTLGDWVNLPLISAIIWYISAKMTGQYHRRSIVSSQRLYQSFMLLKLNILNVGGWC